MQPDCMVVLYAALSCKRDTVTCAPLGRSVEKQNGLVKHPGLLWQQTIHLLLKTKYFLHFFLKQGSVLMVFLEDLGIEVVCKQKIQGKIIYLSMRVLFAIVLFGAKSEK